MKKTKSQPINKNIGLMVFPLRNPDEELPQFFITQLVTLLAPLVGRVLVITGNFYANLPYDNVSVINVKAPIVKKAKESVTSKAFRLLWVQFTFSKAVFQQSKRVDTIMLYLSSGLLILPVALARLLGKKVVIINTGSGSQSLRAMYPGLLGHIYSAIVRGMEHCDYSLASNIVVYSKSIIGPLGLGRYKDKIRVAHRHFLDFDKFKMQKPLDERSNIVGYIGRLSEEKGVMNFIQAIPEILKKAKGVKFLVGGEGRSRNKIVKYINQENLASQVRLVGWVPHDKLPHQLNELKLLVIPSYTEAGPLIALEAMACGTPVLAAPVGALQDIIKDGKTGFILEDNSPGRIAANVVRALTHPKLEEIASNALNLVKREFTYEKAVARYRNILK